MTRWSLRLRSLLLALAALIVFIPVTVFTLDAAFTNSLIEAKQSELKLMNLSLISAFEFENDEINMPDLLFEEQLNLPDSGYVGLIVLNGEIVWRSLSALTYGITPPDVAPSLGDEIFDTVNGMNMGEASRYFSFSYTAEFERGQDYVPVNFYILNDTAIFEEEREMFKKTVWKWLIILGLGLLTMMLIGTSLILSPVRKLIVEIKDTADGHQYQLEQAYPPEFGALKQSINRLIDSETQQRARYKNSLGDLAHSLKTPLAVALGTPDLPSGAKEALHDVDQLIQRQLKRASAGATAWSKAIAVLPTADRIVNALDKVYRDKQLVIAIDDTLDAQFYGDETDLMELLGNLLDNACKAARKQVCLSIEHTPQWQAIHIDDDGPGVDESLKPKLLTRGTRLDTYSEGQGIGLSVVSDLIDIYEGHLEIKRAPLGGARFSVCLPNREKD